MMNLNPFWLIRYSKRKNGKKKAISKRQCAGNTLKGTRNKRRECARATVFMPTLLVVEQPLNSLCFCSFFSLAFKIFFTHLQKNWIDKLTLRFLFKKQENKYFRVSIKHYEVGTPSVSNWKFVLKSIRLYYLCQYTYLRILTGGQKISKRGSFNT